MRARKDWLRTLLTVTFYGLSIAGCGGADPGEQGREGAADASAGDPRADAVAERLPAGAHIRPELRQVYFGDLRLHGGQGDDDSDSTALATPDDAYRYAKGETVDHPAGFAVQLPEPLDFAAVSDHDAALDRPLALSAWQELRHAAVRHDDPGTFTSFVAFEYGPGVATQGLHRHVLFRGADVPEPPLPRLDSDNPEELWRWLDRLRDRGIEAMAIAHPAPDAGSGPVALTDWAGERPDAGRAELRSRNEPLAGAASWSSLGDALLAGLVMEAEQGFNPFPLGFVGAGITGLWAEANERGALYEALRRRETFASSGPRLHLRLFAGFDLAPDLPQQPDALRRAYRDGVPMGGDLESEPGRPLRLWVQARQDPAGAGLERLQIVKGWIEDGAGRERVFDVACAGTTAPTAGHRCPEGATAADPTACDDRADPASAQLAVVWEDPAYDPAVPAFYYARVLQRPSCRRSDRVTLRGGLEPEDGRPAAVQEQAWSSPIWLHPG